LDFKIDQMKLLLQLFFVLLCIPVVAQHKNYLLVGTYTDNGKSEGIYVYTFNSKNGKTKFISSVKTSNPSFLAISADQQKLYAANENGDSTNNGGYVSAFGFNKKNGTLTFLNKQPSGGNHPCYVACDNSGKWLFAGNYSSGNFSIFPLNENGSIGIAKNNVQHFGKSINKERQQSPHVHGTFLIPDNKFFLVPDLGIDKVMVYQFNSTTGILTEAKTPFMQFQGGAGPRHLDFHPSHKYVYVTEELSGAVAAFTFSDEGKLKLFQTISSVPESYKGSLGGADIHVSPDGRFLYASNRGELNDIVIYRIDTATGILTVAGHQSSLGIKPRNFNFDPSGNFLLVANQESDNIIIFKINKQTGLLTDTGKRVNVPNPVCIKWISK
jgi:6-phosphogluconolactonase